MTSSSDTPEHWRDRAEATRAIAHRLSDTEAKRKMIEMAASYDEMAKRTEERLRR